MRVLVVEDEDRLAELLDRGLRKAGLEVDVARTGEEALVNALAGAYDVILLDLMLPGIDGLEVCRRLRRSDVWVPTMILTARDGVGDRVAGLDSGADDYLTKPFSFEELMARIRALTRRVLPPRPNVLEVGGLRLDPAARRAWSGADELRLTAREFSLLEVFMREPERVISRLELLERVWDSSYENRSNIIEVYVGHLRDKIGRDKIVTVRGAGYMLEADEENR